MNGNVNDAPCTCEHGKHSDMHTLKEMVWENRYAINGLNKQMRTKADKNDVYTKNEADWRFLREHQDISHLASKESVVKLSEELECEKCCRKEKDNELSEKINEASNNLANEENSRKEADDAINAELVKTQGKLDEEVARFDEKDSQIDEELLKKAEISYVDETFATKKQAEEIIKSINDEIDEREDADRDMTVRIDAVVSNLVKEARDRAEKDAELGVAIRELEKKTDSTNETLAEETNTRIADIADVNDKINEETNERVARDAEINETITVTKQELLSKMADNTSLIENEKSAREHADSILEERIKDEKQRAQEAETANATAISEEATTRSEQDQVLSDRIDETNNSIQTETARATAAENAITENLDNYKELNDAALANEKDERQEADNEINTRIDENEEIAAAAFAQLDNDIKKAISDTSESVAGETERAMAAEADLQDKLDKEINNRKSAVSTERADRKEADDALKSAISDETAERIEGDTVLQENIDTERIRAEEAEQAIDERIDTATTNLTVTIDKTVGTGDLPTEYSIKQGGVEIGLVTIPKDLMLKEGEVREVDGIPHLFLTLNDVNKTTIDVDLSKVFDDYTNGNGIAISNHVISIKRAADSENFLVVDANGIAIKGVQTAINAAVNSEKTAREAAETALQSNIDALEEKVDNDRESGTSALAAEATARQEADNGLEQAIETEKTRATEKEDEIEDALAAEVTRATLAEQNLENTKQNMLSGTANEIKVEDDTVSLADDLVIECGDY